MSARIKRGWGCSGNYFRGAIVIKMVPCIGMGLSISKHKVLAIGVLMMGQSRRHLANTDPSLVQWLVFPGRPDI